MAPLPPGIMKDRSKPAADRQLKLGALCQSLADLLWIPQAWILAAAVLAMVNGTGVAALLGPALGFAVLGIARTGLDAVGRRLAFLSARQTLTGLRRNALDHLGRRMPLDPTLPASGTIAALLAEQAEAVTPYLQRYMPVRWRLMLVCPALLLAVAWHSWAAGLILLVAAPLIPLFMALIGIRAKKASEEQLMAVGGMNGLLMDRLRGLPTIRALDAEDAVAGRIQTLATKVKLQTMAVLRIAFLSSAVLELFSALGVALVAVYTGFHLLGQLEWGTWGGRLDLAQGLFILLLAPAFFDPWRELSAVWHDRANGEAAIKALNELTGTATAMPESAATPPPPGTALVLNGIRFAYPGAVTPVINGFDLSLRAGERVALLGPSGSGKSTLLALAAGLLQADQGTVQRLGRIGWVGHRPFMQNASLAANVSLGRPGSDVGGLIRRLLPGKAPARRIGEGGAGLSGGEAVRLALARALADPEAALILADEPTAHLDADTAAAIGEILVAATAGRTLLVATHDPALAARMDRVVEVGA
jgi:ATP-binding cassette subfamily C protein CydD